ncbi:hypothetical protein [Williamsia sp.]|uniref:hypothetical protein n=1 Tax=Williamsia sp. TaxID=1872085 RepID=UPI001A275B9D|nr:hypothetical protein [Williamsia sp.]MBJ7289726.1 hypothetical protein [Williamsia sp.]
MQEFVGKRVAANYWRGRESVGGKLGFDKTGMTFDSHALNFQTGSQRIDYRDIVALEPHRTLGIVNNGLTVRTADGAEHRFVINRRRQVIDFLNAQKVIR